jgi:hypothetical protein
VSVIDHLVLIQHVASRTATAAIQANSATIASRNVALPHGKSRKTTKSALAAKETTAIGRQPGSPRTARAIVSGASGPVAMINKNAIPRTQPCQVAGPATQHRQINQRARRPWLPLPRGIWKRCMTFGECTRMSPQQPRGDQHCQYDGGKLGHVAGIGTIQ